MSSNPRMFSTESAKAIKAEKYGYLNAIHYLAPDKVAGKGTVCVDSTAGCRALCLGQYSGQAGMVKDLEHGTNNVRESRINKVVMFFHNAQHYLELVHKAIAVLIKKSRKNNKILCIRLNGSSDIAWERIKIKSKDNKNIYELFSDVQFVDYTKSKTRMLNPNKPSNLYLTFSRSETNETDCLELLQKGHNVAVVFGCAFPETYMGFPVISGDEHDLRHLDPRGGHCIALTPKGRKAKGDKSGFVVWNTEHQHIAA